MLKVLSTKLTVDELDRFTQIVKQQGGSKAGHLKRLVLDYTNSVGKVAGVESEGNPHPATSSKKDLVKDNHVDSLPPSTESLPVNQGESEGRPETSPKFSIGIALGFASLFLLLLQSQPSRTTNDQSVFDSSSPYLDAYGKYAYPTG